MKCSDCNPKFKVGQRIITNKGIEGHIVIILEPFLPKLRKYYCSMYPGADSGYIYVNCIDLNCTVFDSKEVSTLQALNVYKESQLKAKRINR